MFKAKPDFVFKYSKLKTESVISYKSNYTYGKETDKLIKGKTTIDSYSTKESFLNDNSYLQDLNTENQLFIVNLLNFFLKLVSFLILICFFPLCLIFNLKYLKRYERIVVQRLGRTIGCKGPGVAILMPFIDKMVKVDLRTKAFNIPPTSLCTKDKSVILIGAVVHYRIFDAIKMHLSVKDEINSLRNLSHSCLSALLGKKELHIVSSKKLNLQDELQTDINLVSCDWGIEVSSIELSHFKMLTKPQSSPQVSVGGPYNQLFSAVTQLAGQFAESSHTQMSDQVTKPNITNYDSLLNELKSVLSAELVQEIGLIYLITILESGNPNNNILLDLKNGSGSVTLCDSDELNVSADMHISMTVEMFNKILQNKVNFATAYMKNEIKLLKGSISQASKLLILQSKLNDNVHNV